MKFCPKYQSRGGVRRQSGLTILEMLVSTAMLSFIILGLTAVFVQTQRAFKTGIKASTVTDAGRTITDMIASDARALSDGNTINTIGPSNAFCWTNLYWTNTGMSTQMQNNSPFRTNESDAIFFLERTNNSWMGVGYAVKSILPPGNVVVGTLYRYQTNYSAPYLSILYSGSDLFDQFLTDVNRQSFTNQAFWHPIADGVITLKIRAYDQNGNEPYYDDYAANQYFSYPIITQSNTVYTTNVLPAAVDIELGILEPDALTQARTLAGAPNALQNFMLTNAVTRMEIFRERVGIPIVAR